MADLVKFNIPASFVTERVFLASEELLYGYKQGWLAAEDVVQILLAALKAGKELSRPEEELALLLSRDLDRVPALINDLEHFANPHHDPSAVWLFLALAWIYEHRADFADPFEVIDMLYADFGYPDSIRFLASFIPPESGMGMGRKAIEDRWRAYLVDEDAKYRSRS